MLKVFIKTIDAQSIFFETFYDFNSLFFAIIKYYVEPSRWLDFLPSMEI